MLETLAIITGTAVALGLAGGYYAAYSIRSQILGKTIWRGKTDSEAIALTFDDGPSEDTESILNVLREYDVKATFFMVGSQVERLPDVARRVVREGHQIGNHSLSHSIYLYQAPSATRRELEESQQVIVRVTGVTPTVARPPCGVRTPAYFAAAHRLGLKTIQWTVAGFDWKPISAKEIAENVLKEVLPGSIVLLHDGDDTLKSKRVETVRALPMIIEGVRSRNLRITTLKELCGESDQPALRAEPVRVAGDNVYEKSH